jgi:hypothetical protein
LETKDFHIEYGDMSTEGEDCIVADKEGLIKLKSAIDEAIESGVYFTDLDEFSGIICKKKDTFKNKPVHKASLLEKLYGLFSGLLLITIFFSGIYTILNWIF